jgi:hypothetical protein
VVGGRSFSTFLRVLIVTVFVGMGVPVPWNTTDPVLAAANNSTSFAKRTGDVFSSAPTTYGPQSPLEHHFNGVVEFTLQIVGFQADAVGRYYNAPKTRFPERVDIQLAVIPEVNAQCPQSTQSYVDVLELTQVNAVITHFLGLVHIECPNSRPSLDAVVAWKAKVPFSWISFTRTGGTREVVAGSSGVQTYTLTSQGTTDVPFGFPAINQGTGTSFAIVADTCSARIITVGQSCVISVRFDPTEYRHYGAELRMTSRTIYPEVEVVIDMSGAPLAPDRLGENFHMITPTRLLDTRAANGVPGVSPLGRSPISVRIAGRAGIPANATGVIANLTVTSPTAGSYLTVWPTGQAQPVVSNINFVPGETIANMATLALGNAGMLELRNDAGTTHAIIDVIGWFGPDLEPPEMPFLDPSGAAVFMPITPQRVFDSRPTLQYPVSNHLIGGAPRGITVPISLVPPTVGNIYGVLVNLTAINPTADTYLTAYSLRTSSSVPPNTSNLNLAKGTVRANLAVVEWTGEQFLVLNKSGLTHFVVDVLGFFVTPPVDIHNDAGRVVVLPPIRRVDTRKTHDPFLPLEDGGFPFPKAFDDTHNIGGVIFNSTVTNPSAPGFMTMFPWDVTEIPYVSTSNFVAGQTVANQSWVRLGAAPDNYIGVWNASKGTTDVILDVQAIFLE